MPRRGTAGFDVSGYEDPSVRVTGFFVKVVTTSLDGLLLIEPEVFRDSRGFFLEAYQRQRFHGAGIAASFVQDGHSRSRKGVLRGMHYQLRRPQGKLVYVVRGEIFDVAIDIRVGSPTFGQWYGTILSDENHHQVYVSPGFAHGFEVLSAYADVVYKCTDYYDPEDEGGVPWDDPAVGIEWPLPNPIVSQRDMEHRNLSDHDPESLPQYDVNP
jgi:dTDP-4-dehydrorhamnose 3,5-epimerase